MLCHHLNPGVPLAIPAAQAAPEAPAKNVSVTLMAPCLSPVTQSRGSARADPEPRGRSVMAASTGMRVRARSVFVRTLALFLVLGPWFHFCLISVREIVSFCFVFVQ